MKHIFAQFGIASGALFLLSIFVPAFASADTIGPIDFESPAYTAGVINGQNGWTATGSAGSGCAVYDEGVVVNAGAPVSFQNQSFRISNAVTSGCFGDQAFSVALNNAAGETGADVGSFSEGTLQPHFESQFDIFAIPGSTGDIVSVSPDRGDGARMSYLRFDNEADGIHVYFDDDTDPSHVTNADTFNETQVALLNASVPHTIKFSIDFYDGPDNDVVKIYIDGNLVKTGTSWEDYYLYDTESNPGLTNEHSRIVRTMLFRAAGTAVPANAGKGFLIDNLSLSSGPIPPVVTPSAITNSATAETSVVATVNGTDGAVNADNTSFWWGTTAPSGTIVAGTDPGSSELPAGWQHDSGLGAVSANGVFSENLTGLTPGTTYYFVAWIQSGGVWYPGNVLSFITPQAAASCPAGTVRSDNPIETISVDSSKSTPSTSTTTLVNNQKYLLVSSGIWQNGGINIADTAFASLNNWTNYQEGYDMDPYLLGPNEFNLEVEGNFVNWGPYDVANHTYSSLYTGTGNPLDLLVFDGNSNDGPSAINSSWYGDNSGNLSVAVYSCNIPPPVSVIHACDTPDVVPAGYTLVPASHKNNIIHLANHTMYVGKGGNDIITAGNGPHIICTGSGNDFITVGVGDNVINAGGGNNTITARGGNNYIIAGAGNDIITTGAGNDTIDAGNGNNIVNSGAGNDTITTGSGNDVIHGGPGIDTCHAGGGHNLVFGCE